jgi:hypothetical protein
MPENNPKEKYDKKTVSVKFCLFLSPSLLGFLTLETGIDSSSQKFVRNYH